MAQKLIHFTQPSLVETSLTGWFGSGKMMIRNVEWEANIQAGEVPSLKRKGVAISWEAATNEARRFANEVSRFLTAPYNKA
jgi:hypothetical protein